MPLRALHPVGRVLTSGDGHLPRASQESGSLAEASHLLWDPRPSSPPRPQPAPSAVLLPPVLLPPVLPSCDVCHSGPAHPAPPRPCPASPTEADPWLAFRASTWPWRACAGTGTSCGNQEKESLPCDRGWHGARCPSPSLQGWSLLRATPRLTRRVLGGEAPSRAPPFGLGSAPHSCGVLGFEKVHRVTDAPARSGGAWGSGAPLAGREDPPPPSPLMASSRWALLCATSEPPGCA